MLAAPRRTLKASGRPAHIQKRLQGAGPGSSSRRNKLVAQAVSTESKMAPAVTQTALDTMFQDDSDEQVGVVELEVQGALPEWLEGDFYRTGPGLLKGYVHWFDGLGMLVNFRFARGGGVSWQQRFLETADYKMYREAGNKPQLMGFKYSPGVFKAVIGVTDNASVTFYPNSADRSEGCAFTEALNGSYSVDMATLQTKKNLASLMKGEDLIGDLTTAHPKQLANGDYVNLLIPIPFGRLQVVTYQLGDPRTKPKVLYNLEVSNSDSLQSWMHDIPISDNYIAIVEQPLFHSLKALLGSPDEYGIFSWKPEYGTAVRVMALDGSGEVASFKLPAMFSYHWVNSFEKQHAELGACMCLDVFLAEDARSLNMFDLDKVKDATANVSEALLKFVPIFTVPVLTTLGLSE